MGLQRRAILSRQPSNPPGFPAYDFRLSRPRESEVLEILKQFSASSPGAIYQKVIAAWGSDPDDEASKRVWDHALSEFYRDAVFIPEFLAVQDLLIKVMNAGRVREFTWVQRGRRIFYSPVHEGEEERLGGKLRKEGQTPR